MRASRAFDHGGGIVRIVMPAPPIERGPTDLKRPRDQRDVPGLGPELQSAQAISGLSRQLPERVLGEGMEVPLNVCRRYGRPRGRCAHVSAATGPRDFPVIPVAPVTKVLARLILSLLFRRT